MKIVLMQSLFTNNEYVLPYADKTATFTIIDETFEALGKEAVINRVICLVENTDVDGNVTGQLGSMVIGVGDMVVGASSTDPTLIGKLLDKDNMAQCTVELYE